MNQNNLPYNSDAEAALLGNILQYKTAIQDCIELNLEPDDFYIEKHKIIYETALNMFNIGDKIDPISMLDRLECLNQLKKAGGKDYILSLIEASISPFYTREHIKVIKSKSIIRQITKAADEIKLDEGCNETIDNNVDSIKEGLTNVSNSCESRLLQEIIETCNQHKLTPSLLKSFSCKELFNIFLASLLKFDLDEGNIDFLELFSLDNSYAENSFKHLKEIYYCEKENNYGRED